MELTLVLSAPLTSADCLRLSAYNNLVSLLTQVRVEGELQIESRKGLSDSALFDTYYRANYQTEPKSELKELFLSTLAELQEK